MTVMNLYGFTVEEVSDHICARHAGLDAGTERLHLRLHEQGSADHEHYLTETGVLSLEVKR